MNAFWPGSTVGVIGGGQLARMFTFEARRMGYRVAVLSASPDDPAVQVADRGLVADESDPEALETLIRESDVITFDYEHVSAAALDRLETHRAVHPSAAVLRLLQDRLLQRRFLHAAGVPQVPHAMVDDFGGLLAAAAQVGVPCVLKTRRSGYDGRGQVVVTSWDSLPHAWRQLGERPSVLEAFVPFERELSIVAARDPSGAIAFYPVVENIHVGHVLRATRAPARVDDRLTAAARSIATTVAMALEYVGVFAVEFFLTRDRHLLVNEVAPRTHNSGHYTYGACVTSQFEQHLRAICGLPLGDTALMRPAVMLNLLGGEHGGAGNAAWSRILADPRARLHLYGKREDRPGRKMGHVLVVDEDARRLDALLASATAHTSETVPVPRS